MPMSLADISSIANLLAAIGVLITLIYLSRQVRQGEHAREVSGPPAHDRASARRALSLE